MNRALGFWLLLVFVVSCAGASTGGGRGASAVTPADLYPLRMGYVWSYDVDSGEKTPTLAITKVQSVAGSRVTVRTNQGAAVHYEMLPDGISAGVGVWLLRSPIRAGESWPSRGGRVATVAAVDESITTIAGSFESCVRVEESGGELGVEVTTIYCPAVGPVFVRSSMATQRATVAVTARLRGYSLTPSD